MKNILHINMNIENKNDPIAMVIGLQNYLACSIHQAVIRK